MKFNTLMATLQQNKNKIDLKEPKSKFILFIIATFALFMTIFDCRDFVHKDKIPQAAMRALEHERQKFIKSSED